MAKIVIGAALVAGAATATVMTGGAAAPLLVKSILEAGISIGASLTMSGIAEDLRGGPGYSGSIRQPAAARQCVYGQARVSGVVIYASVTGHQFNQIVAWAGHECASLDAIYFDGRKFIGEPVDGDYLRGDQQDHYDDSGQKYNFGHGVYVGTKAMGQAAGYWYQSLNGQDTSKWDSSCTLNGICASYFKLTYNSNQFSGPPNIKATIKGKKLYDPRNGATAWSNNAALVIRDFLMDSEFGLGCTEAEIDEDSFVAAANLSDELVPLAAGGSERRYTINGAFDSNRTPGDILQSMLDACAGKLVYSSGKWGLVVGAWYGSSLSFDDSMLIDKVQWTPTRKYRDLINTVRGTFICPAYPYTPVGYDQDHKDTNIFSGEWQPVEVPEYAQDAAHGYATDANLAADGGVKLYGDTRLEFVTSVGQAQRLLKIKLLRNRQQGSGVLVMDLPAYAATAQSVVQMTLPALGWTAKYLEVDQFHLVPHIDAGGEDAPSLGCELSVIETSPLVYAWSTQEERGIEDTPSPTLGDTTAVTAPTGLALEDDANTAVTQADGTSLPRMLVTWTQPDDPFVTGIQVQYQMSTSGTSAPASPLAMTQNADGTWSTAWLSGPTVAGDANYCYIQGISQFASVSVRIRAFRANGATSDWVTTDTGHAIVIGQPIIPIRPIGGGGTVLQFPDGTGLDTLAPLGGSTATQIVNSNDYLTSADKASLVAQWNAEATTQTALHTAASTYSLSTSVYDTAIEHISTALVAAGAPANWATSWPDGTVGGPWPGIKTNLANLWAQVDTQRTALQTSISAAQAASAQSAAISSAATDATTKMNSAISAAQTYATTAQAAAVAAAATDATTKMNTAISTAQQLAPVVVSSLPTLPNSSYPAERLAWNTGDGQLYRSTGSAWVVAQTSAANVFGQITAGQIAAGAVGANQIAAGAITTKSLTVANFDNLIPNPNSEQAPPAGGWPAGAYEGVLLTNNPAWAYSGSNLRAFSAPNGSWLYIPVTSKMPCGAGDQFYFEAQTAIDPQSGASRQLAIGFYDSSEAYLSGSYSGGLASGGYVGLGAPSYSLQRVSAAAPVNAAFVAFSIGAYCTSTNSTVAGFDNLYARRMNGGELTVDGSITTQKLAAGSVTTNILAANAVTSPNIAAGSITANKLAITPVGACINYDPAMQDTTAWTQDGGTGIIALNVGPATTSGSVGGTFTESDSGQDNTLISVQTYPIDPAKVYKLSANLFTVSGNNRNIYIFVEFYTGSGAYVGSSSTGWGGTRSGYVYGGAPTPNAFTRCGAQFGAGTSRPIPSNVSKCKIGVWFQYAGAGSSSVAQVAQDLRLEPVVDASLIVNGTITAEKANVSLLDAAVAHITYLDGNVANLVNLHADNITAGTMSATRVLFADGTALTSAARVSTATTQPTGSATSTAAVGDTNPLVSIPGFGFTVASNGTGVFNVTASVDLRPSNVASTRYVSLYLVIDGNTASPYAERQVYPPIAGAVLSAPFFSVVTGLSAGSHTFQFYLKDHAGNATYNTAALTTSFATCQRIF